MRQDGNDEHSVISMTGYRAAARFGAASEVAAYWEAIRAGRLVPRRSDIDPRGIERALEYAFILERVAPGIARLRIAGSHLSDLLGMEVRGMPISAFMTAGARNDMGEVLEEVFDGPSTAELDLEAEGGIGKPAMQARLLLLPMKSDLGDISRALGCLVTAGEIGRSPRRFEITARRVTNLLGDFRLDDGPEGTEDAAPAPAAGRREPQRPFVAEPAARAPAQGRPGPVPWLRIVAEND